MLAKLIDFAQPPSGGCELKHLLVLNTFLDAAQPPSGGCELKPACCLKGLQRVGQPPSGGCELKRRLDDDVDIAKAASRLRAAVS